NIGVEPSEIGRLQNDDEVIRQACLQF
ncbi:unnamed protein product, partial [Rotaria magnacalcarata]